MVHSTQEILPKVTSGKQKLCILLPTHWEYAIGGAEYQAKLFTEYLVGKKDFEIHFLGRKVNRNFVPHGYKIHDIGYSTKLPFLFDLKRLLCTLEELAPRFIYQHVGCAYTGIAAYYCERNLCDLIWHVASDADVVRFSGAFSSYFSMNYLDKKILEYGIANTKYIVTQTETQSGLLRANYQRQATTVVGNFHPSPVETISKDGPTTILWIANLKPLKQPAIFLRLAQDLSHLPVRFIMMGALQGDIKWQNSIAVKIQESDNVDYLGAVSQKEVNALLANAHCLVNTSTYEGFSNTFIQAWMRETPVASLNVDPDGLLERKNFGFCAGGEYDRLKLQLEELVTNVDLRNQMGRTARDYSRQHHSFRNMDQLYELF